ncbi:MAG: bis-aminopropyl spermidine synthase family protein, partial [Candidatus Diapherotrites archaeon]|nr:bis-aminopropyl spermidine synthase family protein [Candidatus Diapherotrites archaeon]
QSLKKRLEFIYDRGELRDANFIMLGDDDLFSVAIALTGLAGRITVLEIDKEIIELIRGIAKERGLGIEAIEYNAANALPKELASKFDVAVTEPPETEKALQVFLSRSAQALKESGSIYFGLTEIECSSRTWLSVQKTLNGMGFVLTDILRNHTEYPETYIRDKEGYYKKMRMMKDAPFPLKLYTKEKWYRSSFLRAKLVGKAKPAIEKAVEFGPGFYQNEDAVTIE